MSDVVIVGGGVVGLTTAYELAGQGASVTVLEQGQFGQEASWAGAGILYPGDLERATSPESKLRAFSFSLWKELSLELEELSGINNGFRNCGGITVGFNGESDLRNEMKKWSSEGTVVEWLDADGMAFHEYYLATSFRMGFRLPGMCQVRNPRHLKALHAGCLHRGVRLIAGVPVVDWQVSGDKVLAARDLSSDSKISGSAFVIASGAWTQRLFNPLGLSTSIVPVRGQIVLLNSAPGLLKHIVEVGPRYLVPRSDGRILAGSTEEWVGFQKGNTVEGVESLLEFAIRLIPELKNATVERFWSGLRPRARSGQPIIGRVTGYENLYVAAGHFRSGLQLSPATAVLVRQLLLGQPVSVPLTPFEFKELSSSGFNLKGET